ncbi:MAG: ParB N-terminal domain-containing protein [Alphaproteobacteria bacterium]
MMKAVAVPIAAIYVPAKFKGTLDGGKVDALAEDILEHGLTNPISVRRDGDRYVLVQGLHRLEAVRALGETAVPAFVVAARQF